MSQLRLAQSPDEPLPNVQPDGSFLTSDKEEEESISVEGNISSNSQDENILANIGSLDIIAQKISPNIQEKLEKFELDDTKRKAEKSPELSKKDKKKIKNRKRF